MSKDTILYKRGNATVGITEEGDYFESTNGYQRNILRTAGEFITHLLAKNQALTMENEHCTCSNFHEGNCTKSNFYEYEVIDMKLKKSYDSVRICI